MSSFIINLLIPILIVLAVGIFRTRDAWLWSWPAWAIDVDYLGWMAHVRYGWPNVHRALFHNVWWLLILVALAAWQWRRWRAVGGGPLGEFARAKPAWLLMPFFYTSHLILDIFAGGITAFWPLSRLSVFWTFRIEVDTSRPIPQPEFVSEAGTYVGVPDVSPIYTWMTAEEFALFALYLLGLALAFVYRSVEQGPKPDWARGLAWFGLGPTAKPEAPKADDARPARRTRSRGRARRGCS